jgi:hypothetical protein
VLLVRRDLNVVWSNDGLNFIWIVESLDIVQIRDIKSSNMVAKSDSEVGKLSVIGDIRVDGQGILCTIAKVIEKLCNALVSLFVLAEWIDDPYLTWNDGTVDISMDPSLK